jgi:hypothetical protein
VNLPKHACGLTLEHNPHLNIYMTVEQYLKNEHSNWGNEDNVGDFPGGEREKAIATNELWTLHWYPDTPVGFYRVAASTLEALLAAANEP